MKFIRSIVTPAGHFIEEYEWPVGNRIVYLDYRLYKGTYEQAIAECQKKKESDSYGKK